ncbi:MAG: FIST signal transduction protein [Longimicrobiales bacterium]
MLNLHVGHSQLPDTSSAVEECIQQIKDSVGRESVLGTLLFASSDHDTAAVLDGVRSAFPEVPLVGCTTSGELTSAQGFCEGSLVLTAFSGEGVEIGAGIGKGTAADPREAGAAAAKMAQEAVSLPSRFCLTFPDGLTSNCDEVVQGIQSVLGETFPIFGGAAADDWKFEKTYQCFGNGLFSDSVPVLLFAGEIDFSFGCAHGWTPFTKRVEVTHSEGNVVYTIDGRPALDLYRHYVGTDASPSAEYPLAVFSDEVGEDFYLRAGMQYDAEVGSITFAGDVPQSSWVQISKTSRDTIVSACKESLQSAVDTATETSPQAALVFSCAARKEQLGTRTKLETQALNEHLATSIPMAGFYCYAEIAPLRPNTPTQVHNETFITLLLNG